MGCHDPHRRCIDHAGAFTWTGERFLEPHRMDDSRDELLAELDAEAEQHLDQPERWHASVHLNAHELPRLVATYRETAPQTFGGPR